MQDTESNGSPVIVQTNQTAANNIPVPSPRDTLKPPSGGLIDLSGKSGFITIAISRHINNHLTVSNI
jgi:hypothetical protein